MGNEDKLKKSIRDIVKKEWYLFIGTNFNTIMHQDADSEIVEFTKWLLNNEIELSSKSIRDFWYKLKSSYYD